MNHSAAMGVRGRLTGLNSSYPLCALNLGHCVLWQATELFHLPKEDVWGFFSSIDGLVVVFEQDFAVAQAILKYILISLPLTPACWD